jgi:hypothetical protein
MANKALLLLLLLTIESKFPTVISLLHCAAYKKTKHSLVEVDETKTFSANNVRKKRLMTTKM